MNYIKQKALEILLILITLIIWGFLFSDPINNRENNLVQLMYLMIVNFAQLCFVLFLYFFFHERSNFNKDKVLTSLILFSSIIVAIGILLLFSNLNRTIINFSRFITLIGYGNTIYLTFKFSANGVFRKELVNHISN